MKDQHQHTWLPVKTVLTGSLIMYYDCRCGETISIAEHKRRKLAVEGDWYCPTCDVYISGETVTFEEVHEVCGTSLTLEEA